MAVESATYINGLNASLPNANDEISEGDDHIRLIKNVLQNTFPNISAAVNASAAEMNTLVGLVISSYMRTLLDDADAATARTTLGAMASVSPGTSGNILTSNGSAWVSAAAKWLATSTQSLSSGYTVVAGDAGKVFDCSGTFTLALTAVATLGSGFVVGVRNSGSGTITIDPNGSETVDGQTTVALSSDQSCILVCTGSAWITLGRQTGGVVNVQTFTTAGSHTWYKPAAGTMALIECWGGGGSGEKNSNSSGGKGGGYTRRLLPLSSLAATESVVVGSGGAGVSSWGPGNNGGDTTFGTHVTAYGGHGGNTGLSKHYAASHGGGSSGGPGYDGGWAIYGGGGGGGAATSGGVSLYGGNGGAGSNTGNGGNGAAPGGGGGATSANATSGSGAQGACRVTVF